ncbi:MAG: CHASE2 domain-containing protein, partial [Candidatus Desantisbacteria bacterium]
PRSYYAELLDYLKEDGVLAVGSDVAFPEHGEEKDDNLLISATKRAGNIVHSFFFPYSSELKGEPDIEIMEKRFSLKPEKGMSFQSQAEITPPIREIQETSAGLGHFNRYSDVDGMTRSTILFVNYKDRLYPALSLATLCQALKIKRNEIKITKDYVILGSKKKIPVEEGARMWINYVGESGSFNYISFVNVLKKRIGKGYFKGKIVLLGGSAEGLFDLTFNPFTQVFPGIEIHANVIHSILEESYMTKAPKAVGVIIVFVMSIMIGLFSSSFSLKKGIFAFVFLLSGYVVASMGIFEAKSLWIEMVSPSFSMTITFVSVWLWRFSMEQKKKEEVF